MDITRPGTPLSFLPKGSDFTTPPRKDKTTQAAKPSAVSRSSEGAFEPVGTSAERLELQKQLRESLEKSPTRVGESEKRFASRFDNKTASIADVTVLHSRKDLHQPAVDQIVIEGRDSPLNLPLEDLYLEDSPVEQWKRVCPPRIDSQDNFTTNETTAVPSGRGSTAKEFLRSFSRDDSTPSVAIRPESSRPSRPQSLSEKLGLNFSLTPSELGIKEKNSVIEVKPFIPLKTLSELGVEVIKDKEVEVEAGNGSTTEEKTQQAVKEEVTNGEAKTDLTAKKAPATIDFYESKGITIGRCLSSGAFGRTYEVDLNEAAKKDFGGASLIYKEEKIPKLLTNSKEERGRETAQTPEKIWRHYDFAALRIDPPLPHLVKVKAMAFQLFSKESEQCERFYVPANKVRDFLQAVPPTAQVSLVAQFMEKAPGQSLDKLIKDRKVPNQTDFLKVAVALDEFLRAAHERNFIHRDLKPANIMYDTDTGEVTIIDTGESSRLRKRGKTDEEIERRREDGNPHISNPEFSTAYLGTRKYMAPTVEARTSYGSEVDFFSSALVLLQLLSPDDFKQFNEVRFSSGRETNSIFADELKVSKEGRSPDFLQAYLNVVGSESRTAAILKEEPHLRNLIDSYFKASLRGEAGERAFRESQVSINALRVQLSEISDER